MTPGFSSKAPASIFLVASVFLSAGCASIVHGGNQSISISSVPPGATASVAKLEGEVVAVRTTPCTVSLDPKRGYFKGQSYTVKIELSGYKTAEIHLQPELSGWYFGNILLGGLIGMVAVDPVTGSMWNIEPAKIEQALSPAQSAAIGARKGFVVILASALKPGEREHMVRMN